ncbi:hypothetical protein NT6N_21220 [Oceaniferula spumae]|uniref:FecR protein domain-containing protein n=1 Tax=Oceaniferula spumae TaxID=2979115 RepID=A0AAT9FMD8_9BACT
MIPLDSENVRTVDHLIQDLEDGLISPEDRAKLMNLMREHVEVRELYLKHTQMVALLQQNAESRAELGTMPVSQVMSNTQSRRTAIVSFSYGIAALLLLGVCFWFFHANNTPDTRQWIVMEGSVDAKYVVSYSDDESRDVDSLQPGDKISVQQGLVQFTFPSGVKSIIEGPSQLELTGDLSVKMDGGQAWFRVPEAGHGFTVQTRNVNVVDLGTEFGVRFDDDENIQIHVSKGKVMAEPAFKAMDDHELIAGQAMAFDANGKGEVVEITTSLFRQKFTHSMPYLHWSFDRLENGAFVADGTMPGVGDFEAKLRHLKTGSHFTDPSKHLVKGKYGNAFSMDGKGLFAESAFPGIGGNTPRTIAMWIRHRQEFTAADKVTPYCVWGQGRPSEIWKFAVKEEGDSHQLITTTYATGHFTDLNADVRNQWTHIASVYTGKQLANGYPEIIQYINGVRQDVKALVRNGEPVVNTNITSSESKPVRFGAAMMAGRNSLNGDIDEVFLFRGVLSDEQITQLVKENRLVFSSN